METVKQNTGREFQRKNIMGTHFFFQYFQFFKLESEFKTIFIVHKLVRGLMVVFFSHLPFDN